MNLESIKQKLLKAFPSAVVEVSDLTGGGDHIEVFVKESAFKELSRVERHQAVMAVFTEELKSGEMHALAIRTEI